MASSKKVKPTRRRRWTPPVLIDYYTRPFLLLQRDLIRRGITRRPHPLRESFWRLVSPGEYAAIDARPIVLSYLRRVEMELSAILSRQSLAYWLHLYRRIAPAHPFGEQDDPATILSVREVLDCAIQKYATFHRCSRVAISGEVSPDKVFRGLLMAPQFEPERRYIQEFSQLLLTDFGVEEFHEFIEVEKLSFEIWRATAALRILGKGSSLIVDEEYPHFYDNRSNELNQLVTNYDQRYRDPNVTATGTVFADALRGTDGTGLAFLPFYNVHGVPAKDLSAIFELFRLKLFSPASHDFRTNFLWVPFALKSYLEAHLPFADAFETLFHLPLSWLLAVVAALCYRVHYIWNENPHRLVHYWQRAYEGPYKKDFILREIEAFLPAAIRNLGLQLENSQIDVERLFSFIELTEEKRSAIDLVLAGPHFLFLPFNDDRFFIDYCWFYRFLYHLFYRVEVSDQNFKGLALERLVHRGVSVLPIGPCKSLVGELRQIDAAFAAGENVVIVECRAVGRSFGVDRGDEKALNYRRQVVDKALEDIDEKAQWLSRNAVGVNFDITKFKTILPIAVTPFVEYIHSINARYWLTDKLPRVMTPSELRDALENRILESIGTSPNAVPISR
jgi:hypothetical protein